MLGIIKKKKKAGEERKRKVGTRGEPRTVRPISLTLHYAEFR